MKSDISPIFLGSRSAVVVTEILNKTKFFFTRVLREGVKKTIDTVIMIIPRRTPLPSFFRTVIALGYFFCYVFQLIG